MAETLFVRSDEWWGLYGSVAENTAIADPAHELAWLVDGRWGFPARFNGTTASVDVTPVTAGEIGLVAVCHHNLQEGAEIDFSGDVVASLVVGPWGKNLIPYNVWQRITPAVSGANNVTIAFAGGTGGAADMVIGEIVMGKARSLTRSLRLAGNEFGGRRFVETVQNPLSGIPPYSDRGLEETIRGNQVYEWSEVQEILDWHDAQDRTGVIVPSLLVLDSENPYDARLVTFASRPTYSQIQADPALFLVDVDFLEYPRIEW